MDRESLRVALAVVTGVAFVGFFLGTSAWDYEDESVIDEPGTPEPSVPEALSYTELRAHPRATTTGWSEDLAALREAGPGLFDEVTLPADKSAALAARASLRAYDGAPPRVPHAVRQDSAAECLACHDEGLRFRGLTAPALSHDSYTSCTQCHVVEASPVPGGSSLPHDPRAVANSFDGIDAPTAGPRAWSVAPPQVPHRVFMRENCDSCHGVNGRDPIRSSHPYRESCTQCHASANDAFPVLP
ncbi:MAG: hypothetical protein FJ102_02010 [Deltaproteobacteria bacterium]|nr:hypothetical protein [Deltaproteobacteria bacterium]